MPFASLSPQVMGKVVEKFVLELENQLEDRQVTLELTPEAQKWLAVKGYDVLYGARPLTRIIQNAIKKPLAEELLFGKLTRGGYVGVDVVDGKLSFSFTKGKRRQKKIKAVEKVC